MNNNNSNGVKRRKIGDDSEEEDTLRQLSKSLVRELSAVTTNTTTVMGQLDRTLPYQPLLQVEGYGLVALPVTKHVATELGRYMEQAPFGMGEDTVMDITVRDTLQVGPEKFKITNKKFSEAVMSDVVSCVKQKLGLKESMEVRAEPYKLLLYMPGGHFKPHRDTEKASGMFGTLIVQLPSVFTGGNLVVRHGGKEVVVEMSQEDSSSYCMIAAHYSDCEHEVTRVLTGYRLALVYSLCWRGSGEAPSAERMMEKAGCVQPLLLRYSGLLAKASKVCWVLEHLYSDNYLDNGGTSMLKGKDRAVVETVLAANQMLRVEDQFEVMLAKASKVNHEYGDCRRGYGYGRNRWGGGWGGGRCDGGCFEITDCHKTETNLSDFIDVLSGQGLTIHFDEFTPEIEVLNIENEDAFWGDGQGECSGPSGNAGATRDFWYNKWLLVLWRKSDSFMIKSKQSIMAGMQHILITCKEGNMVEATEQLEQLLSLPATESHSQYELALDIALAIEHEEYGKKLLNNVLGPHVNLTESVVTKIQALVVRMTWPVLETTLLQFMDKMRSNDVSNFALDLALVIKDKGVCKKMLDKGLDSKLDFGQLKATTLLSLIKKFSWPSVKKGILQIMDNTDVARLGNFALDLSLEIDDENLCKVMIEEYFSPKIMNSPTECKVLDVITKYSWQALEPTVLQLMDQTDVSFILSFVNIFNKVDDLDVKVCDRVMEKLTNDRSMKVNEAQIFFKSLLSPLLKLILLFPTDLVKLGKQLTNMPCLTNPDLSAYLASEIVEISELLPVMPDIEESFLLNAGNQRRLSSKTEAVSNMIKVMTKLNREDSLQAMVTLVLAQPDHQTMLASMLPTVTAETGSLPAPLLTLTKARVAFLQPRVVRGPPGFNWRQRKAVIPGHKNIEEFFRGKQKSYTHRGFTGIAVARKWAHTHCQDRGTCAAFAAGGHGAASYVQIVKKAAGFEKFEMTHYRLRLEEHTRLMVLLPTSGPDTLLENQATNITAGDTIDLTMD